MKRSATELAVALDVPDLNALNNLLHRLPTELRWCKAGLELFCAEGPRVLELLKYSGKLVFLDLKLHDIPRTVQRAVQAAARHGANILTVHASGGRAMLKAASDAARSSGDGSLKIIAVTALTSLSNDDLGDIGISRHMADHVLRLAGMALEAEVDGLVCSPLEVKELRKSFGPDPILVTPGIRASGANLGDQKRTATASQAVQDGSSLLVVGRPIVEASDPSRAASEFLNEIANARA